MSSKEITELRKKGKLNEALQMANQILEIEPENIWNKRAAAWVYYEYLKKYAQADSFELFKANLIKIKELELPESEKTIFDNCAWQIGKLVFSLQKIEHVDYAKINEIFEIIKDFHFTKPSEEYSFIYKAFHKGYQKWSKYLAFADWWDFENLRPEDYLKEEFNNIKIMSIAEQAYIAYSKKLLTNGVPLDSFGKTRLIDKEKIHSFLPKLESLIDKHPEYQYPPYYKAKLLLALGDAHNALSTFLPFARQKRNEFWIWTLMAEIFSEDIDIQFACYCKALSLKTPDTILVNLRQTFAGILITNKMYDEAKTEIQKIIETRRKEKKELSKPVVQWTKEDWYQSAIAKKDNMDLYSKYLKEAEEILYQDIPEELVAVEFVNKNKSILNFVKDKQKFGFFNYSESLSNPQIGDLLKLRFHGEGQDGFYKILTAKKVDSNLTSEAIKQFQGTLKVIPPQNFGFVEDVFIDSQMVEKYKLNDGQTVEGRAILSFNKKKDEWGWKAIEVKVIN